MSEWWMDAIKADAVREATAPLEAEIERLKGSFYTPDEMAKKVAELNFATDELKRHNLYLNDRLRDRDTTIADLRAQLAEYTRCRTAADVQRVRERTTELPAETPKADLPLLRTRQCPPLTRPQEGSFDAERQREQQQRRTLWPGVDGGIDA